MPRLSILLTVCGAAYQTLLITAALRGGPPTLHGMQPVPYVRMRALPTRPVVITTRSTVLLELGSIHSRRGMIGADKGLASREERYCAEGSS